jgi:anthranilate synthase component 1
MIPSVSRDEFVALARHASGMAPPASTLMIPVGVRLLSDQLTPVLAYRRLVVGDERTAPSFLLESVEGGERRGRYSIMGAHPAMEVVAREHEVTIRDRRHDAANALEHRRVSDPLLVPRELAASMRLCMPGGVGTRLLPGCMLGGWVGYASYDTVRYAEPSKLPWQGAPRDDRGLPDLHFGFYDQVVVFDHVDTLVHVVQLAAVASDAGPEAAAAAYERATARLSRTATALQTHSKPLPAGELDRGHQPAPAASNLTRAQHAEMVERAQRYINAGDIFQVVLGQRFERPGRVDPFDVYRALRAVNPSPYMGYLQAEGCILIASSPEILCRVRREARGLVVTNRPLAGTRRRGATPEEDTALEKELLADPKERAEHIMLVDLGRNDVGVVAERGTVELPRLLEVERYSHVMHISSTVTGVLRQGLDCWDALRAALPVGTISGAPKVRAMQVIDELEPVRRGPYGGGFGYITLDGQMDMALALRTVVVPTALRGDDRTWTYHVQAAGGIVADSDPEAEYQETVNKAAALLRAIDVAERAFAE